jgi:isopentenyl-diphosphate delta-isomerase
MKELKDIADRKAEHLDICRTQDVESTHRHYWDAVNVPHRALPEIDLAEVSLRTKFLSLDLKSPLLISSMTGGSPEGEKLNEALALFAQQHGIAMGVGSQRIALERPEAPIFKLRKIAPQAVLFANLGAVQFNYGVSADDALRLAESLEANAFILHLNPLQEAIQPEGNTNFRGLLAKIENFKKRLSIPLIVKEVGCGLDVQSAIKLREAGVDAIDIAGKGGTHWGFVEGLRDADRKELGDFFRDWGTPTPELLLTLRQALGPRYPIIASGGIRSGVDAAKAFYLGANLVGMALPFLREASKGPEALDKFYETLTSALRTALFCMGRTSPQGE